MKTDDLISTAHKAIEHFGQSSQRMKTIEELGELVQALAKFHNFQIGPNEDIYGHRIWHMLLDEIADCFIMLHQMRLIFGAEDVDRRIEFKLNALNMRIDEQQANHPRF